MSDVLAGTDRERGWIPSGCVRIPPKEQALTSNWIPGLLARHRIYNGALLLDVGTPQRIFYSRNVGSEDRHQHEYDEDDDSCKAEPVRPEYLPGLLRVLPLESRLLLVGICHQLAVSAQLGDDVGYRHDSYGRPDDYPQPMLSEECGLRFDSHIHSRRIGEVRCINDCEGYLVLPWFREIELKDRDIVCVVLFVVSELPFV